MKKAAKITALAAQCYERLENSLALIKLLRHKVCGKDDEIVLNMVLSDIKSTIEFILEIQEDA